MARRSSLPTRSTRSKPSRKPSRRGSTAGSIRNAARPDSLQDTAIELQRAIGNRQLRDALGSKADQAPVVQREGGPGVAEPQVKKPGKKLLTEAKALKILQDAYGGYRKIQSGKVVVLAQAGFQKAWDKIYGKTEYAWNKYVKPGNLEGFAHEGTNYINESTASIDALPHEMLHSNAHGDWTSFAGSELNEGTTEYLTIKAAKAAKITPSHSYPRQEAVVRDLVKMTSEAALMKAYFKGDVAPLKKSMEKSCKGSWAAFKSAMQAKSWAKARAHLKPKAAK